MSFHPSHYYPELAEDRLQLIANRLLDVRYNTIAVLQGEYDTNYVRECAVFGRQHEMLIQLWASKEHPWLDMKHAGMDLTFYIGSVPCRFFTDDPKYPQKHGFFRRNQVDQLFAPEDTQPVMWRFVIERAMTQDDEDSVYLIGYNVFEEKVCEWRHRPGTGVLHAVDATTPPSVDLPDAEISVRETGDKSGDTGEPRTGTDAK